MFRLSDWEFVIGSKDTQGMRDLPPSTQKERTVRAQRVTETEPSTVTFHRRVRVDTRVSDSKIHGTYRSSLERPPRIYKPAPY